MIAGELVGLIERLGLKGVETPTFFPYYRNEVSRLTSLSFNIKLTSEVTGEVARVVKDGLFLTVYVDELSFTFFHRFTILLEVLLQPLLASKRVDLLVSFGDAAPNRFEGIAMCGSDAKTLLIPDIYFIRFRGYEILKREIDQGLRNIPEPDFTRGCYWRGSATGHRSLSPGGQVTSQRIELCRLSKRLPNIVDARLTGLVDLPEESREDLRQEGLVIESFASPLESLHFPIQIDVDGYGNAYSSFFWKLFSKRLTIKVGSVLNLRQWFYSRLKSGVHFFAVNSSLSDLEGVAENLRRLGMNHYWSLVKDARQTIDQVRYEREIVSARQAIATYIAEHQDR